MTFFRQNPRNLPILSNENEANECTNSIVNPPLIQRPMYYFHSSYASPRSPRSIHSVSNTTTDYTSFILAYKSILHSTSLPFHIRLPLYYHLFLYIFRHISKITFLDSLLESFTLLLYELVPSSMKIFFLTSTYHTSNILSSFPFYELHVREETMITETRNMNKEKVPDQRNEVLEDTLDVNNETRDAETTIREQLAEDKYQKVENRERSKLYIGFPMVERNLLEVTLWIKKGCDLLYLKPLSVSLQSSPTMSNANNKIINKESQRKLELKKIRNHIVKGNYFKWLDIQDHSQRLASKRNEYLHIHIPQCFYLYAVGMHACLHALNFYSNEMHSFVMNLWKEACTTTHEFLRQLYEKSKEKKSQIRDMTCKISEAIKKLERANNKRKDEEKQLMKIIEEYEIVTRQKNKILDEIQWQHFNKRLIKKTYQTIEEKLMKKEEKKIYYENEGKYYELNDEHNVFFGLIGDEKAEVSLLKLYERLNHLYWMNRQYPNQNENNGINAEEMASQNEIKSVRNICRTVEKLKCLAEKKAENEMKSTELQTPFYALLNDRRETVTDDGKNNKEKKTANNEKFEMYFLSGDIKMKKTLDENEQIKDGEPKTQHIRCFDTITLKEKDILPSKIQCLFVFLPEDLTVSFLTKAEINAEIKRIFNTLTVDGKSRDTSISPIEEQIYDVYQLIYFSDPVEAEKHCYRFLLTLFHLRLESNEKDTKKNNLTNVLYDLLTMTRTVEIRRAISSFNAITLDISKQDNKGRKMVNEMNEHEIWQFLLSFYEKLMSRSEKKTSIIIKERINFGLQRMSSGAGKMVDEIPEDFYIDKINMSDELDKKDKEIIINKVNTRGYDNAYTSGKAERNIMCIRISDGLWWIYKRWRKSR